MNCIVCGKPLHVYTQPALMAGRPARELAECHTVGCDLEAVTLHPDVLAALTPEQVDSYALANFTRRTRVAVLA